MNPKQVFDNGKLLDAHKHQATAYPVCSRTFLG